MTPYPFVDHAGELPSLVLVRTPSPVRVLAAVVSGLVALVFVGLIVTPWVQTAIGAGRVVAFAPLDRQQSVKAPVEGRPVVWHVREGSRVRKGEPIVELADNDPLIVERLLAERAAVEGRRQATLMRASSLLSRRENLVQSREGAVAAAQQRVSMARQRVIATRRALEAAQAAQKTTQLQFDRQKKLVEQGLSSLRTLELAELDERRAATEIEAAIARLAGADDEVIALQQDLFKLSSDGSAAMDDASASRSSAIAEAENAAAELARLDVRIARQGTMIVTAPRDGTILRLASAPGEFVKSGDNLAVLVPDSDERAVELWIDGNDVPLVTEGREVRLQFEGWPALQLSGWPSVALGTFGGQIALVDVADDDSGRFRVLVTPLPGEAWPTGASLRQGQRAQGWVLLNTVPLGFELWRQFNGFPPALPGDPSKVGAGEKRK